jgi:hypothetical protein
VGEMRNAHNIYFKRNLGKRPLGINRRRWEDNYIIGSEEIELA